LYPHTLKIPVHIVDQRGSRPEEHHAQGLLPRHLPLCLSVLLGFGKRVVPAPIPLLINPALLFPLGIVDEYFA
jgi:hypothetical protein